MYFGGPKMEHFTAFDLQRHVGKVQSAALVAPVAITHHGRERLVVMNYDTWLHLGRGDALSDAIKRLQTQRGRLAREGIARVSIFGSVARGDAREDSDIDLLVEPVAGVRVGGLRLAHWKGVLTEIVGREADVVVREFLTEKVAKTMERDLIDAAVGAEAARDAA
jgi:predicted nucleotidyltransferase